LALTPLLLSGQNLKDFEKQVSEFSLANGLHFIVVERRQAPIVAFHTYVNVGSMDDPVGQTGLANIVERMAYKGTESIGSLDWAAEKKDLDAIEEIYDQLAQETNKWPAVSTTALYRLRITLGGAIEHSRAFTQSNEYASVLEENGGAGLNARISPVATEYYCILPSNRIELWFLLESQRLMHPVFREFYREGVTLIEEYNQRAQSNAQATLLEHLAAAAFESHPYRNPVSGWPSDIAGLRASQAKRFFQEYYVPGNMVISIVGDLTAADAKRLAEKYFGGMPSRPQPSMPRTQEPPQLGARYTGAGASNQTAIAVGYKRPPLSEKDAPVFEVLQSILTGAHGGLLRSDLVETKRIAASVQSIAGFPDPLYTNLFVMLATVASGHTIEENEKAINEFVTQLQQRPVPDSLVSRAKIQIRAGLIRRLADNAGLAAMIAAAYGTRADWKAMFTALDDIDKVTADDVQRVATQYLVTNNRTSTYIVAAQGAAAKAEARR
jgi:predicted Zn-dependent peptidase